jgi:transposase
MEILFSKCAGGDVHQKTVVVCARWLDQGRKRQETRTFGTTTGELLKLGDWLAGLGITHLAIESTGVYWKPVYWVLEERVEVWLVNAQHVKKVPGRKTDVSDAEWLATVMAHGLVRASFVPPKPQRELRDLTRQRANLVRDRTSCLNRLQKVLEDANVKLASVVSDVNGVSALAMLRELVAGHTDPRTLAELARGTLRTKRTELEAALTGRFTVHHRFLLMHALMQLDFLDDEIEAFTADIERRVAEQSAADVNVQTGLSYERAIELWDSVPGVNRRAGQVLVAEIGVDTPALACGASVSKFPSAEQLASWTGVCPGNDESAGKRRRGTIAPGDRPVRKMLIQVAHAAARTKGSYLQRLFHRVSARRGKKRAWVAVAHAIVISAWHMLKKNEGYKEPQPMDMTVKQKATAAKRAVKKLEKLGYTVTLTPNPLPTASGSG